MFYLLIFIADTKGVVSWAVLAALSEAVHHRANC
nr:MAG TPA: hypothetical protein [Caudoviricetes sp.]